jgi:hypothetical protein
LTNHYIKSGRTSRVIINRHPTPALMSAALDHADFARSACFTRLYFARQMLHARLERLRNAPAAIFARRRRLGKEHAVLRGHAGTLLGGHAALAV